jgi:O-antigen ligase
MGVGIYGYYRELLGGSIGVFKYPHNLFLQFALEFGIFGAIIILLFLSVIIYLNFKLIEPNKGWLFVLLLMVNFKLLVTGSYLWEPSFWICLTLGLKNLVEHKIYMRKNK